MVKYIYIYINIKDKFDISQEENNIIKKYQFLTQYMLTSINRLNAKNETIQELYNQQIEINNSADELIHKQVKIIFF
jgi:hypothetical protein